MEGELLLQRIAFAVPARSTALAATSSPSPPPRNVLAPTPHKTALFRGEPLLNTSRRSVAAPCGPGRAAPPPVPSAAAQPAAGQRARRAAREEGRARGAPFRGSGAGCARRRGAGRGGAAGLRGSPRARRRHSARGASAPPGPGPLHGPSAAGAAAQVGAEPRGERASPGRARTEPGTAGGGEGELGLRRDPPGGGGGELCEVSGRGALLFLFLLSSFSQIIFSSPLLFRHLALAQLAARAVVLKKCSQRSERSGSAGIGPAHRLLGRGSGRTAAGLSGAERGGGSPEEVGGEFGAKCTHTLPLRN